MRRLAGRLPAHRPSRLLRLLRELHPRGGLHGGPACQVAQGLQPAALASEHRFAEPDPVLQRLAAGPQRLHPSGSRLPGSYRQQEGGRGPSVSAAGCQLPAVLLRSLHPQPRLCERAGHLQTSPAPVADHGAGCEALHPGCRHLGVGFQRRRPGTRRGHGLLRRYPHAGDAGGRQHPAQGAA